MTISILGKFVIRLLLYVYDLILIAKLALGLQEHLHSLEHFCKRVGMQVNISKTKVVVFSNKRKHNQHILEATFWKKWQITNTSELTSTEI